MTVEPTPDHVPCRHCTLPISWDDVCWVHDHTGFADCHIVISAGVRARSDDSEPLIAIAADIAEERGLVAIVDPVIEATGPVTYALPIGEWS